VIVSVTSNVIREEDKMNTWLNLLAWVVFSSIGIYTIFLSLLFREPIIIFIGLAITTYGVRRIQIWTREL